VARVGVLERADSRLSWNRQKSLVEFGVAHVFLREEVFAVADVHGVLVERIVSSWTSEARFAREGAVASSI
jgi:hypothetical protein